MSEIDLVEGRQHRLLEELKKNRRIHTNEAAEQLNVSVDTVRRDLRELHDRGLLRRVHGGAVPVSISPSSFVERQDSLAPSRALLARNIVDRFRTGQIIGLDAGVTGVEIAALVPQTLDVVIVTNSPAAALALADHRSAEVVLLGGDVDLRWMATTGVSVVDGWRSVRVDVGVLGVCGVDPGEGLSTRSRGEVETKRALIASSSEVIVPVQNDKLGVVGPYAVCRLDEIDLLVSETNADASVIGRCRESVAVDAAR